MCRAVLAIFLALCLPFNGANAQSKTITIGGAGGTPFNAECPPGQFLVGLFGFMGQIVDGIGLICAPWLALHSADRPATTGQPQDGKYFGGRGANSARLLCPAGSALSSWLIADSHGDSPRVVGSIEDEECRSLAPPTTWLLPGRPFSGIPREDQAHRAARSLAHQGE